MSTTTATKTRLQPASLESQDAEERMSRDELEALQLVRLKETVRHAYENVPHYRAKLDAAGVYPDDIRALDDITRLPFTTKEDLRQNYPFGMFAVPSQRGRAHSCVVRNHRTSHCRRIHQGRSRDLGGPRRPLAAGIRRSAGNAGAQCVRLRAVHGRARRPRRHRGTRRDRHPDVRRPDDQTGAAHSRLRARHHHVHARRIS